MRSYLPFDERVGAAEHQEPAAALADEVPQERELIGGEEAGFDVVEDDRVVTVELVGRLGKTVSQLDSVEQCPQTDQDRLVVPLGRVGVGMVEAVEKGLVAWARALRKSNFGWRVAIRSRPTSWTCSSSSIARRRNLNSQLGRPLT